MTDKNNESMAKPAQGEESSRVNAAAAQASSEALPEPEDKGGADGKTKQLGGKGLGDYPKSEGDYD